MYILPLMGIRRSSRATTRSQASIQEQRETEDCKPQLYVMRHIDYTKNDLPPDDPRRSFEIERTAEAIAGHIASRPQLPNFNFLMILHTMTLATQTTSAKLANVPSIKVLRPIQTRRTGDLATFPPEDIEALHFRLGGDALKLAMASGLPTILVGHWDTAKIIDPRAPRLRFAEAIYISSDEIIDIAPGYDIDNP